MANEPTPQETAKAEALAKMQAVQAPLEAADEKAAIALRDQAKALLRSLADFSVEARSQRGGQIATRALPIARGLRDLLDTPIKQE